MTSAMALPAWAALPVAIMALTGAGFTLIGAMGLLRFRTFYERVHAPTLGTTFGVASIVIASSIFFSVTEARLLVHTVLIAVFVTVTTPVTLMLLVRASLFRDRTENAARESGKDKSTTDGNTQ